MTPHWTLCNLSKAQTSIYKVSLFALSAPSKPTSLEIAMYTLTIDIFRNSNVYIDHCIPLSHLPVPITEHFGRSYFKGCTGCQYVWSYPLLRWWSNVGTTVISNVPTQLGMASASFETPLYNYLITPEFCAQTDTSGMWGCIAVLGSQWLQWQWPPEWYKIGTMAKELILIIYLHALPGDVVRLSTKSISIRQC